MENFVVELNDKITKRFVDQIVVRASCAKIAEVFAHKKTHCVARVVNIIDSKHIPEYTEFWESS